jgi:hypothetical protein
MGHRHFGLRSRREDSNGGGGGSPPGSHGSNYALPSESLFAADLPLPRSKFVQAVLDVAALVVAFLLVSATGCGLAFALLVLFFVRV